MDKSKKHLAIAFGAVLIVLAVVSTAGILLLRRRPEILQGEIEATEIRISGKLLGRIDRFLAEEGQNVRKGDTLVVINSPEVRAKYDQVDALKNVAVYENQKVESGTRRQITETMYQMWQKSKSNFMRQSELQPATVTYERMLALYKEGVVTSQRKDEAEALWKGAAAAERAAGEQYRMARDGARRQDRESAQSMVAAAESSLQEVAVLLEDARLTAPEAGQIAAIQTAGSIPSGASWSHRARRSCRWWCWKTRTRC